jgi:excinuclease UvrABC helicase subunit UvrB
VKNLSITVLNKLCTILRLYLRVLGRLTLEIVDNGGVCNGINDMKRYFEDVKLLPKPIEIVIEFKLIP